MFVTKFGSVEKKRRPATCAVFYLFENVWQGAEITPLPTEIGLKALFVCTTRYKPNFMTHTIGNASKETSQLGN